MSCMTSGNDVPRLGAERRPPYDHVADWSTTAAIANAHRRSRRCGERDRWTKSWLAELGGEVVAQRGRTEITFETATEPFAPRATATASTGAPLANRCGSRNARYGAESSIATRRHAPPRARVAKVTEAAPPRTVAASR